MHPSTGKTRLCCCVLCRLPYGATSQRFNYSLGNCCCCCCCYCRSMFILFFIKVRPILYNSLPSSRHRQPDRYANATFVVLSFALATENLKFARVVAIEFCSTSLCTTVRHILFEGPKVTAVEFPVPLSTRNDSLNGQLNESS